MSECLIALDLETTGLNPKKDHILEIGAAKICDGTIVDTYSVFVNPGMKIPEFIVNLTGITDEMAKDGLSAREAVKGLIDFVGDGELLGHNILFDYGFVKQNAVNFDLEFEKDGIDTLGIARKFLAELPSRSLESLCAHYGIHQEKRHRAYEDAISAYRLYERMKKEFETVSPGAFWAKPLIYQVKKESVITNSQKRYLIDLTKYHRINLDVSLDTMTKSEASRMIDTILSQYGKIKR